MCQFPKPPVAPFPFYYYLVSVCLCVCVHMCVNVYTCMYMMVLLKRDGAKKKWWVGDLSLGYIGILLAVLVKVE